MVHSWLEQLPHMSKQDQVVPAVLGGLGALAPEADYHPTHEQRQLKARFWMAFRANPIMDEKDVVPSLVEELTGKSVAKWVKDPEFWAWFTTKDHTKQTLEAASERAAELAFHYLNPAVPFNDNARVSLIKIVLEFSGRAPAHRKEIKWLDKEISELSPEQLDALIAKLQPKKALPEGQ